MSKNIYKNDLKFEDQDDTNKIKLRLKIFKDEKYDNLDLSKLNENMVNKVFKSKIFLENKNKIKHLFINESKLKNLDNLPMCEDLETLDISDNKLTKLPILSKKIKELNINNNNIEDINILNKYNSLEILDSSNNKIKELPSLNNCKIINIDDNFIEKINDEYPKLKKLYINNNKLKNLNNLPKLEILEISNNNINNVSKLKNLKELVCNNLEIINLSYLDNLESLEIINTNINKLDYFKYLNVVITDKNDFELSEKYKINTFTKNKKNILTLYFSTQ